MNDYLAAQEGMRSFLALTDEPMNQYNKFSSSRGTKYMGLFEELYEKMLPSFETVDRLWLSVGEPEQMLQNMAEAFCEEAVKRMNDAPGRRKQDMVLMDMNMQIAIFVFPCILHFEGGSAQPLCDAVAREWKKNFPKSNVSAAKVEEIEQGFHHKWCYITTAVCRSKGKADDCYELELFRRYRDTYLLSREDGEELIRRYYDVAPSIVKHINAREDAAVIYDGILKEYLEPCVHLIEEGKNQECCDLYRTMVDQMTGLYFFSEPQR